MYVDDQYCVDNRPASLSEENNLIGLEDESPEDPSSKNAYGTECSFFSIKNIW